jgi:hypothetical protein
MPVTPERLCLDYKLAMAMAYSGVVRWVQVYTDSTRAARVSSLAEAYKARYYVVEYAMRSLIGPGRYHDRFAIGIDLNAPDYPEEFPPCRAVSTPWPWVPRISKESGAICVGKKGQFDSRQQFTLAHLILHIARLLNLDEPARSNDLGYCPEATAYWFEELKLRPITTSLEYPALPMHLLYPELTPEPPKKPTFRSLGRRHA